MSGPASISTRLQNFWSWETSPTDLLDINVLVYAHREDARRHRDYREWMQRAVSSPEPYGIADSVLAGYVRIVTNRSIFPSPTPLELAIENAESLRGRPNAVQVSPGTRHWTIFRDLVERTGVRGPAVTDAWYAALAMESGCTWVTADRDFGRFPGLRWRHPLS